MDTLEFEKLKKRIQDGKLELARAEGGLNQAMEALKTECGLESIEAAEALLINLEAEEKKASSRLEVLMEDLKNAVPSRI